MILEYYSDSPYSQQMVYAKFIELWVEFARNINIETSLENLNYPKQVSEIINYIYAHCATVTLAETAEKFNFSTGYLSSYILKYTHRSFNELLRHFKLQTAARYLTHSDLSIEMIADSVGYNDTSYFRKIFKTEFGMSPREYRHARRTYS
jgi:YesN/AraC family two-component response regulator